MRRYTEKVSYNAGTAIPSNADLDTYTENGKYFASTNSIAATLTNCPTSNNFVMLVFTRTTSAIKSQLIIDLAGNLYIRSASSSAWRSWKTFVTLDNLGTSIEDLLQEAKDSGEFTPVKGVDYWTDDDQAAIVHQVILALGTPVFGTVDENNTIIVTGDLVDGTYTLAFSDKNGRQADIGTVNVTTIEIVPATFEGYMIDDAGALVADSNYCCSSLVNFDEPGYSYVFTFNNVQGTVDIAYYSSDGTYIGRGTKLVDSIEQVGYTDEARSCSFVVPQLAGADSFRVRIHLYGDLEAGLDAAQASTIARVDTYKKTVVVATYGSFSRENDIQEVTFDDLYAEGNGSYKVLAQTCGIAPFHVTGTGADTWFYPIKVPDGKTSLEISFPYLSTDQPICLKYYSIKLIDGNYVGQASYGFYNPGIYTMEFFDDPDYIGIIARREDWGGLHNHNLHNPEIIWS